MKPGTHTTLRRWLLNLAGVYFVLVGGTLTTEFKVWTRITHHVLVTALLGAWLVSLLRRRRGLPSTPLDWPLLAFFGAQALAAIFATDPRVSAEGLWLLGVNILLLYTAVDLMRAYGPQAAIEPVFFAGAVVVLVGLIEFAAWYFGLPILPTFRQGWFSIGGLHDPIPPTIYRLTFTLNVSTWLAAFLGLLIPAGLGWALASKKRDSRQALGLWLAGALAVLGLTFSRGGLLALAVALPTLAALLVWGERGWRERIGGWLRGWRVWVALAAVLVAAAGVAWGWTSQDIGGHRAGDRQRLDLWHSAWQSGLGDLLTGTGPGGFGRALRRTRDPLTTADHMTTPHNVPLLVWAEAGLPGVLALAGLAVVLAGAGVRRWQETDGADRVRVAGALAGLLGFAVYNLVDNFITTPVLLPALVMVAYVVVPQERQTAAGRLRQVAPVIVLTLVALAGAGWAVSDGAQVLFERSIRLSATGDLPGALAAIETAQRTDPALGLYAAQRAQIVGEMAAQNDADVRAALAAYEEAFNYEDTSDVMRANYAALLAESGDVAGALEQMQQAARIQPLEPVYMLWVGRYQEELDDQSAARNAYLTALSMQPGWAASPFWDESMVRRAARAAHLDTLGMTLEDLDRVATLPEGCWRVAAHPEAYIDATEAHALACLAWARLALEGDANGALSLAERAVSADRALPAGYIVRAEASLARGELDAAERDARRALFLGERGAYSVLGRLAEARGDLAEAERAYLAGGPLFVQLQGYDVAVYGRRGGLHRLATLDTPGPGRYSLASWLALARLYEAQGRIDAMQTITQAILTVDPYFEGR